MKTKLAISSDYIPDNVVLGVDLPENSGIFNADNHIPLIAGCAVSLGHVVAIKIGGKYADI